jgi:hypothetical protein
MDFSRLGVFMVGIVNYSTGGECAGGSGSVLTCWGRIGGGGEGRGREWMRKGRKRSWGRTMDCHTRQGGKVKGVRIGIRK